MIIPRLRRQSTVKCKSRVVVCYFAQGAEGMCIYPLVTEKVKINAVSRVVLPESLGDVEQGAYGVE